MAKFYSDEDREKILKPLSQPQTAMSAMSEATGLRLLDGIYMLIEILMNKNDANSL